MSLFSGEVSYRIGEKGAVKVLFSSDERAADERTDREVNYILTLIKKPKTKHNDIK